MYGRSISSFIFERVHAPLLAIGFEMFWWLDLRNQVELEKAAMAAKDEEEEELRKEQ